MQLDDLDLDRESRPRRRTVRVGFVVCAVLAVLILALVIQRQVETSAALHRGPWNFEVDYLPAWLPPGFSGELLALRSLPLAYLSR